MQTVISMKIINWHVKMGLYLGSYEVTYDLLHGPPLKWDCDRILSIGSSSDSLELPLTETDFGFPLGVLVIGSIL